MACQTRGSSGSSEADEAVCDVLEPGPDTADGADEDPADEATVRGGSRFVRTEPHVAVPPVRSQVGCSDHEEELLSPRPE